MRFLESGPDGGDASGVTGYWAIELKGWFSLVLLHFAAGTRDTFHSHAFDAVSLYLMGAVDEEHVDGSIVRWRGQWPWLKFTSRAVCHRVRALRDT